MHTQGPAAKEKRWYFILVVTRCQGHTSWDLPRHILWAAGHLNLHWPLALQLFGVGLAMARRLLKNQSGTWSPALGSERVESSHAKSRIKE